jgi:hypothetical protein
MFCAPRLIFTGNEGAGFRFQVLRTLTHFRRYRGRHVPFSCFARPDSFSTVLRAFGPVFMFCAPRLVFDGNEGVGYRFHVLPSRSRFPRYKGRRVPFSNFALPDSFSAVPRESGPVFMFCAPEHVFGGADGVGSRLHVLCSRTHFRQYRGHPHPFSYFTRPESFSALSRASSPVFMFCAPRLIFGGNEGAGYRFHVLRPRSLSHGTKGVVSCF